MASAARQIVKDNGLSDVITVIQGFVEDAEIPVRMMVDGWPKKTSAETIPFPE